MKFLLFFLLFICIVLMISYALKKQILSYFCRLIKKKTGCMVSISTIGFSIKGIYFKQLTLTKATLYLEIDSVRLGLSIRPQFLVLRIGNLNCYHQPANQTSTNTDHTKTEKTNTPLLQNVLARITNLFARKYPKICRYSTIKTAQLQFFDQDRTRPIVVVEQLIFEKQKIVFELNNFASLQSKYRVLIRFNRHKILYAVTNLLLNSSDSLQTAHLRGKIAIGIQQQLTIGTYAKSVILNSKKVSNQPLALKDLNVLFIIDQFDDRIELNPDSTVQFNQVLLEMKGRYQYEEDLCSMMLYLTSKVEHLIALIPNLQTNPLKDFSSEGEICVGFSLGFLWSDPLHYKFDLDYNTEELKIINPGIDLLYLENDFSFKSTINRENHRVLHISKSTGDTENQHLLSKIIQLSEDPNFYKHNGIDSYFIGVAIANNLAQKQFFKGASTLSMQLIKNLCLGEEKSITRKLEELILTLLMENYFKIRKERILEIYLQVIELGPEIYGINEAAKFYYNKTVDELNVLECLAISYIIPRPRFFLEALIAKSEQLNHNLSKHIENKLGMLVANRMITKDQLLAMGNKIEFYQIGELELNNLNTAHLARLFTLVH
ncbi:biosynthetic peptidoglycan transglycosylase [Pedobacter sp. Hv1]|uniref:biosynthetic peptidoglycan transglycosylase n=1 Tax=Pedobacter sp. Hv1 TaxID=1740090 RepID=UPI00128EC603|nr:biosynthetic peptidoglycan transglycosylase [Pedobacter sp. Hv1]